MPRLLAVLFLAGLSSAGIAQAQSREVLADAARAFDESALRAEDNSAKPMPVRKWTAPVRLAFANPSAAPALVEISRQGVKTLAAEAGITVNDLAGNDSTANFIVYFDENGLRGRSGDCSANGWWNK